MPLLAPKLGRAVYDLCKRPKACAMDRLLQALGAERVRLTPPWTGTGEACKACSARRVALRQCTPRRTEALPSEPAAVAWTPTPAPLHAALVAQGCRGLPLPRA